MSNDFADIKGKAEKLRKDIDEVKALISKCSNEVSAEVSTMRNEVDDLLAKTLSSPEKWDGAKDSQTDIIKKISEVLPGRIKMLKDSLIQAAGGPAVSMKGVKRVVIPGIILLIIMVGIYIWLHYFDKIPSYDRNSGKAFFRALGRVKASTARPEVRPEEVSDALKELYENGVGNDLLTLEFLERINFLKGFVSSFTLNEIPMNDKKIMDLRDKLPRTEEEIKGVKVNNDDKETKEKIIVALNEIKQTLDDPKKEKIKLNDLVTLIARITSIPDFKTKVDGKEVELLNPIRVSYLKDLIAAWSTSALSQTDPRVVEIKDKIERIDKEAVGLSQNAGFFWITSYWRWLEIVFWGEFGVIVGILIWVCAQLEAGKYTKDVYDKEKYWYLTEVVIGPIVIVAVFFLLKQFIGTLLTGITEEEVKGSIYITLGLSFVLGLYIRRTLGIFDFIKQKLPLPKN